MNFKSLQPFQKEILDETVEKYRRFPSLRTYLAMPTGSGKTVVAAYYLINHVIKNGGRVLWITHSWSLINQAYDTFSSLDNNLNSDNCGLWATALPKKDHLIASKLDSFKKDYTLYGEEWCPKILFSTQATLSNTCKDLRKSEYKRLKSFQPDIVVFDEAHYGKGGSLEGNLYNVLLNKEWKGTPILGLSATPKVRQKHGWDSKLKIGKYSFKDLVDLGFLAKPILITKNISSDYGITFKRNGMLDETLIADDKKRNHNIVDIYDENRKSFGKTLLFAVNKDHANKLEKLFSARGIETFLIHSDVENPYRVLEEFKSTSDINCIAIAVRMLIEGVDIPDLNTVFLAKPVTSDIEFSQMVGRGSRKTDKKNTFNVVDLYDSSENENNNNHLFHFVDFYQGSSKHNEVENHKTVKPHIENTKYEHTYIEGRSLATLNYDPNSKYYKALHGLRIYNGQTFGIEIELSPKNKDINNVADAEWNLKAVEILNLIGQGTKNVAKNPIGNYDDVLDGIDHSKWNVVYDGSCGYEIVSPVLLGQEGYEEVVNVFQLITDQTIAQLDLCIDAKCGFHLNLGWNKFSNSDILKTIQYIRYLEPYLYSLVSPSRVSGSDGQPSYYCQSIRNIFSNQMIYSFKSNKSIFEKINSEKGKYWAVNFQNYKGKGQRLEVRSHQGTIDESKITLWASIWMNVLNVIDSPAVEWLTKETKVDQAIGYPSSDNDVLIIACELMGLDSNREMLHKVHQRRKELFQGKWWQSKLGEEKCNHMLTSWESSYRRLVSLQTDHTLKVSKNSTSASNGQLRPSPELAIVTGGGPIKHSQAVAKVWEYVRNNKLRSPYNNKIIMTDHNLKEIFFNKSEVTSQELIYLISYHLKIAA